MINLYSTALFLSTLISIVVALYAWRRRPAPGAIALTIFMAAAAVWSFGYALELASSELATKLFWAKVQYIGIVTVPTMMLIIVSEYSGRDSWLTRRNQIFLVIEPVLTTLLVWTNENHGWIWQTTHFPENPASALELEYGWWFWLHVVYSYLILFVGFVIILLTFLRSSQFYRAQTGVLLISTLVPWIGNALYQFDLSPFPGLDLTPFAFTITGLGATWGLFRLQLMDITPVAHHAVFENMLDGVIVLDAQARILDVNPAAEKLIEASYQIIGQPAKEVFTRWPDFLGPPDDTVSQIEIVLQNQEDQPRYFDLITSPLYNRKGSLTGQIIVLRDIEALKRMEKELVVARDQALEASRLKSQILTNVSHDMRTPLGAVVGYTEMLRAGIFGPVTTQQDEKLQAILLSCNQLSDFISNLLGQSEIASGKLSLRRQPVSPQVLIQEVLAVTETLAQQKGLEIVNKIAPEMPNPILGDHYWLRRIFANLVGNAVKYTDDGQISIEVFLPDPEHWAIQVTDTGIGISQQSQAEIFEPFNKGDQESLGGERAGSGLGLAIVKEIVTQMNGEIGLESQIGKGSTFTICLPLLPEEEKV